jgi:DegV family protein with EDD domain
MKDFVIMTDSCCDLPIEYINEKNIPYVALTCNYNGKEYIDDFGQTLNQKNFFNDLRQGALPKTSQANSDSFYNKFKEIVDSGKDIIYICVSSGLSGTFNSANIAKNMILDKYSDANIYIVDILTASLGQGLMVMKAYDMKENGATICEIVNYLEDNKQYLNTYITVDDLNHLKRGGRISSTAATVGIVLHIKPILTINLEGKVMPVIKIRGRKKSIVKIADKVQKRIINPEEQTISICHGDCLDEALKLKDEILKRVQVKNVILNYIGPVVGTFGGPGALAVFFMGKERQHHII